jgi:hypothetical protein
MGRRGLGGQVGGVVEDMGWDDVLFHDRIVWCKSGLLGGSEV